ncbi:MAG TPA: hypothetical protein VNH11_36340 [Pirellulales bacterium]|nr:hypothetical protein [Pirellulales bacterium]
MRVSFRQIAKGVYGGHLPRDVAAAVALGVLLGAVTGGNVSWIALLLAAILLNVHTRLFLAAWLASLLLAWLARGSLDRLGRLMLDGTPLGHAIGQLGDGVFVALLGWDQYAFAGGVAAGSVLAAAGALAAYRLTRYLWLSQRPHDPDLPPSPIAFDVPATPVHTGQAALTEAPANAGPLVRIWLGPSQRERSLRRTMQPRRLRRHGAPMAVAASLALVAACWWLAGSMARQELLRTLSACNGAEVSAGGLDLSMASGDFTIRDLRVADPQRAGRDRLCVGLVQGKLSPGLLLRGHLDVERLALSQIRTDLRRAGHAASSPAWSGFSETGEESVPSSSSCDTALDASLPCWKNVCRQLRALQRLVVAVEGLAGAESAGPDSGTTQRRSELGVRRPRLRVRQARVADLANCSGLGRKSLLQLTELTSNSAISSCPAELKVVVPRFGAELRLIFSQKGPGSKHRLECSAYDLDLPSLFGEGHVGRVRVASGRARLSGEGSLDRRSLDVRLTVEAESLAAEVVGRRRLAGIEPDLWNRGVERLDAFKTDLVLAGDFACPTLGLESQLLVEQFQQHLRAVGEYALVDTLHHQLARKQRPEVESAVMQASAVEPQLNPTRPGWAEFTQDAQAAGLAHPEPPAASAVIASDEAVQQPVNYPATAHPFDDSPPGPTVPPTATAQAAEEDPGFSDPNSEPPVPPGATAPESAPTARRLPGPVNMVVGHDPMASIPASFDSVGTTAPETGRPPRASLLSRWAAGLRQRFAPASTTPDTEVRTEAPPDDAQTGPPERVIPAAASEAWYHRRWR